MLSTVGNIFKLKNLNGNLVKIASLSFRKNLQFEKRKFFQEKKRVGNTENEPVAKEDEAAQELRKINVYICEEARNTLKK